MIRLGTALRPAATRVMLLGSGELGKEVAIECQRLGVEVIAVDRYADAPAMHIQKDVSWGFWQEQTWLCRIFRRWM